MKKLLTIPGGPAPFPVCVFGYHPVVKQTSCCIPGSGDDDIMVVPTIWLSDVPKHVERRVIADRGRLVRILLNDGYVPNSDGDFVKENHRDFIHEMWACCGLSVSSKNVFIGSTFATEWLEEVEVDE